MHDIHGIFLAFLIFVPHVFYFILNPVLLTVAWYIRRGGKQMIPCTQVDSAKYKSCTYQWKDHLGRGAARNHIVLHGNGSLEVYNAQLEDSDAYHCQIFPVDGKPETFQNSIVGW